MKQNKGFILEIIGCVLLCAIILINSTLLLIRRQRKETAKEVPIETETEIETEAERELEIIFVPIEVETETQVETEIETESVEVEPVITYDYIKENYYFWSDATLIAMVMANECESVSSDTEQACVAWVILNRVDRAGGVDVFSIVTAPYQFAWDENAVPSEHSYALAEDVLIRWIYEKLTGEPLGRVLPNDYYYFYGDGSHNFFYQDYEQPDIVWDYSLTTPYES